MGSFKEMDKKAPPMPQAQGQRKNNEEVGEPIQLPDDMSKQHQDKPDIGQREGQQRGKRPGGGQQHQGADR